MTELIAFIARALVDNPHAVEIKSSSGPSGTVYELRVAKADLGKLIGREGRTASAIRTVVYNAAQQAGERATLEIVESAAQAPSAELG